MPDSWIAISDISAEGREFIFDDQTLWREGWKEFSLPVKPVEDFFAMVTVIPQGEDAVLLRGSLRGSFQLPCDRCAEDFTVSIDEQFDTYEQLPDGEYDDVPRLRVETGQLQLNIGALLWEEFAVNLPVKPLCSDGCQGMCPTCGANLNEGECECDQDEGDERLAVFRNLKIK